MTGGLPVARTHRHGVAPAAADDICAMTYEDRFLRRKVLTAERGLRFLVDFARTTSMAEGDAFALEDGRLVAVIAAEEELLQVTGDNLIRLAWHIGNRHTPCQIEPDRLLIRRDRVLREMLEGIGATTSDVIAPFSPEGGAYGSGRTHGHAH
jgi:urease accessory protein